MLLDTQSINYKLSIIVMLLQIYKLTRDIWPDDDPKK